MNHHFFFRGEDIFITNTYTYLGVQLSGPRFSLRHALQSRVNKGYGSLAILERQCFRHHFQDIPSKLSLMDALVRPTFSYGSKVGGAGLLESDRVSARRVHTLILYNIIRCKQTVAQPIVLVEFSARPFQLNTMLSLVSLLHRLQRFADSVKGCERYPQLAYWSKKSIALASPSSHVRCWFIGVSDLLESVGISMGCLPPFRYSLNAPSHLLPTIQEWNRCICDDIYRQFIHVTWTNPRGKLRSTLR